MFDEKTIFPVKLNRGHCYSYSNSHSIDLNKHSQKYKIYFYLGRFSKIFFHSFYYFY